MVATSCSFDICADFEEARGEGDDLKGLFVFGFEYGGEFGGDDG